MFRDKLIATAVLAGAVIGAAMLVDYLITIVILHNYATYTPLVTLAISVIVALPVCYVLVSAQIDLRAARDALAKARDEAVAASRAKSEFLANMSHELRTPLNAILGFSELLRSEGFAQRRVEYASLIHASGSHLLGLVDGLLDLARIEANRVELHNEEIDINALIADCAAIVEPRATESRLKVVRSVTAGLPLVSGDRRALKQILLNLLSNAIKFSGEGGTVEAFAHIETDGGLAFGVRDEGVGIDEAEQSRVFERFGQGRHDVSSSAKGTGLGLPIVKGLVEAHGGRVTMHSDRGPGTCVTVWLPHTRIRSQKRGAAA